MKIRQASKYIENSEWIPIILSVLRESTLANQIKSLGGYDVSRMGEVDAVIGG